MTKVISLEASKQLEEYMPEEVTYYYDIHMEDITENPNHKDLDEWYYYKTLTLEEAIDMFPSWFQYKWDKCYIWIARLDLWYITQIRDSTNKWNWKTITWKTLLEAVEKMLLFLLENNLLNKPWKI